MSVDILQEKIRKTKCPIIVDLSMQVSHLPQPILAEHPDLCDAHAQYCRELLAGLKGVVPGVRFSFDQWALMNGLDRLRELMTLATELGYYVVLDGLSALTPWAAERAASVLNAQSGYACHSLIVDPYIGSDAIKPFLPYCKAGKSVFFAVRTPNKSAAELQDMMTGSRLVHVAGADYVKRHGETILGKCGYSHLGVLTAATNGNAVSGLRSKFNRMFLLVDGLDYPGGNGKICSYGFDRFGHGCAISVGPAITAAWQEGEQPDPVAAAVSAAERIRNNLSRYITIL